MIRFAESLDHAMLPRVLYVVDAEGDLVVGTIEIDKEETRWRFRPDGAWREGLYSLEVSTTREDFAGNSIAKPFKVYVLGPIWQRSTSETVSLSFEIRAVRESEL